jgi:hypothetical protein
MKIKINHNYGQTKKEEISRDLRFNDKIWCKGSDYRINTKKPRRKPCKTSRGHFLAKLHFYSAVIFCTIILGACSLQYLPKETQKVVTTESVLAAEPIVAPVVPDLWEKYFGSQADLMKRICTAESGLNANAMHKNTNGSWDYGTCQLNTINSKLWQGQNIFDLEVNLATAKKVLDSQGLTAWTVYKQNKY